MQDRESLTSCSLVIESRGFSLGLKLDDFSWNTNYSMNDEIIVDIWKLLMNGI